MLLPDPVLGMAGWGVPAPDGGDYLSDGYDTPEQATQAAVRAVQLEASGMTREQAWQAAALEAQA